MKVGLHITVYNRKRFTEQCLKSLVMSKPKNTIVYIVDNHSTDGTRKVLEKFLDEKNVIKSVILNDKNTYIGHPINQSWSILSQKCDIIGCAGNDFLFEPGWESNIISCFKDLRSDFVCSAIGKKISMRLEGKKVKTTKSGGRYYSFNGIGTGHFIRSELFLKGYKWDEKPLEDGYVGPGSSFHKKIKNGLKGVQLASPCVLVRNCEYNSKDMKKYYDETFGKRGMINLLEKRRTQERNGNPWGLIDWKGFLDKWGQNE